MQAEVTVILRIILQTCRVVQGKPWWHLIFLTVQSSGQPLATTMGVRQGPDTCQAVGARYLDLRISSETLRNSRHLRTQSATSGRLLILYQCCQLMKLHIREQKYNSSFMKNYSYIIRHHLVETESTWEHFHNRQWTVLRNLELTVNMFPQNFAVWLFSCICVWVITHVSCMCIWCYISDALLL